MKYNHIIKTDTDTDADTNIDTETDGQTDRQTKGSTSRDYVQSRLLLVVELYGNAEDLTV